MKFTMTECLLGFALLIPFAGCADDGSAPSADEPSIGSRTPPGAKDANGKADADLSPSKHYSAVRQCEATRDAALDKAASASDQQQALWSFVDCVKTADDATAPTIQSAIQQMGIEDDVSAIFGKWRSASSTVIEYTVAGSETPDGSLSQSYDASLVGSFERSLASLIDEWVALDGDMILIQDGRADHAACYAAYDTDAADDVSTADMIESSAALADCVAARVLGHADVIAEGIATNEGDDNAQKHGSEVTAALQALLDQGDALCGTLVQAGEMAGGTMANVFYQSCRENVAVLTYRRLAGTSEAPAGNDSTHRSAVAACHMQADQAIENASSQNEMQQAMWDLLGCIQTANDGVLPTVQTALDELGAGGNVSDSFAQCRDDSTPLVNLVVAGSETPDGSLAQTTAASLTADLEDHRGKLIDGWVTLDGDQIAVPEMRDDHAACYAAYDSDAADDTSTAEMIDSSAALADCIEKDVLRQGDAVAERIVANDDTATLEDTRAQVSTTLQAYLDDSSILCGMLVQAGEMGGGSMSSVFAQSCRKDAAVLLFGTLTR